MCQNLKNKSTQDRPLQRTHFFSPLRGTKERKAKIVIHHREYLKLKNCLLTTILVKDSLQKE
ncbi:hypothetical protein HBZC1_p0760 (plasmid) [Helicobacter bizzozeronii CIII-1]|uniref:Uncharacterized protein n=1 Tax=Helicobacter bizzozeronii (strain CIII-1) TaxID=1002804 RepID=F8KUM1_HELBC|nr:hypothetical protein HBZC1_p0760 [Helicobacter bizzozeronii CIII-1]